MDHAMPYVKDYSLLGVPSHFFSSSALHLEQEKRTEFELEEACLYKAAFL
jgi:hypothetical protein